jgi:hypothetical protein
MQRIAIWASTECHMIFAPATSRKPIDRQAHLSYTRRKRNADRR